MKIRHVTLDAGPAGVFPVGFEHVVPDAEAEALIAGGYAVAVDAPAAKKAAKEAAAGETATQGGGENAAKATGGPAKGAGKR